MAASMEVRLVAEVGNKVSLFDENMMQVTEWVELVIGVDQDGYTPCLFAKFKAPEREANVTYSILWDIETGLMQPQLMDLPMTLTADSCPIEYRIVTTYNRDKNSVPMLMRKS